VIAAGAAAKSKVNKRGSLLKIGVDIHREKFVVVAQFDHATPRPPQGFAPAEFVPWVEARLGEGLEVYVVSESCGLGSGLYRSRIQAGAHGYVIAAQQLDERNTRVKTDGRDARELCLRLDRYLAGNKDSLAVIRVPSEEEERADTGAASVSSLSVIDRKWRLRAAVCLSIMVGRRRRAGGGHKAGPSGKLLPVWRLPTSKFVGRCSWPSISKSAR
jgi:hypothetical protein